MPTLELVLDNDQSVFVSVEPSPTRTTTRVEDVATGDITDLKASFAKVSASLAGVVKSIEAQLDALPRRPDTVAVEFGAQLKGEADLWLVSGEATGHMKVTLTWTKPKGE